MGRWGCLGRRPGMDELRGRLNGSCWGSSVGERLSMSANPRGGGACLGDFTGAAGLGREYPEGGKLLEQGQGERAWNFPEKS